MRWTPIENWFALIVALATLAAAIVCATCSGGEPELDGCGDATACRSPDGEWYCPDAGVGCPDGG